MRVLNMTVSGQNSLHKGMLVAFEMLMLTTSRTTEEIMTMVSCFCSYFYSCYELPFVLLEFRSNIESKSPIQSGKETPSGVQG